MKNKKIKMLVSQDIDSSKQLYLCLFKYDGYYNLGIFHEKSGDIRVLVKLKKRIVDEQIEMEKKEGREEEEIHLSIFYNMILEHVKSSNNYNTKTTESQIDSE